MCPPPCASRDARPRRFNFEPNISPLFAPAGFTERILGLREWLCAFWAPEKEPRDFLLNRALRTRKGGLGGEQPSSVPPSRSRCIFCPLFCATCLWLQTQCRLLLNPRPCPQTGPPPVVPLPQQIAQRPMIMTLRTRLAPPLLWRALRAQHCTFYWTEGGTGKTAEAGLA
jgi:hypothetical protein